MSPITRIFSATGGCFLAGAIMIVAGSQEPTLRTQLEARRLPVTGIEDLDRTIAELRAEDTPQWFAIAYYWNDRFSPNRPSAELRIRIYDREKARWTSAVVGDALRLGSVTSIRRQTGWVYVDTHLSPSAGALLVLSDDLKVRRRLDGWAEAVLRDGRVVYATNMVHVAPAHPGALSLYDPASDRDVPLYPPGAVAADSPGWMVDRSFQRFEQIDSGHLAVTVVEQDVTLRRDNTGAPTGPRREFRITCDIVGPTPTCRARPR